MSKILFIKHINIEGPETLGVFFQEKGLDMQTIELSDGERLPEDLTGIQAVVSLGGPMNVYEEEKYPFLKKEDVFLKQVVSREIPFLGLCLGSQLLAKACGAKVEKSPQKEVGFLPVQLTELGQKDPLFSGINTTIDAFQWHEDMFQIPEGAQLLASSPACPHQAFKVGPYAYGLQFHVEITDKSIRDWSEAYFPKEDDVLKRKKEAMLKDYAQRKGIFDQVANQIYLNFLEMVNKRSEYLIAKMRAIKHMEKGYNFGGKPLKRDELYDR